MKTTLECEARPLCDCTCAQSCRARPIMGRQGKAVTQAHVSTAIVSESNRLLLHKKALVVSRTKLHSWQFMHNFSGCCKIRPSHKTTASALHQSGYMSHKREHTTDIFFRAFCPTLCPTFTVAHKKATYDSGETCNNISIWL